MTRKNWAEVDDELPEDEHDGVVEDSHILGAPEITEAQDGD